MINPEREAQDKDARIAELEERAESLAKLVGQFDAALSNLPAEAQKILAVLEASDECFGGTGVRPYAILKLEKAVLARRNK